jgi:hypothetical protein
MNAKWGRMAPLGLLLLILVIGCRSAQPDLKPATQPEVFNPPSTSASLTGYPRQAFKFDDPSKRNDLDNSGVQQARGMSGPPPASFGGPGGSMR